MVTPRRSRPAAPPPARPRSATVAERDREVAPRHPPCAQPILPPRFLGADRYPTLPSRLTLSSFWASTANSIGSSRKTSLQNPLTIRLTASSVDSPRCRQ